MNAHSMLLQDMDKVRCTFCQRDRATDRFETSRLLVLLPCHLSLSAPPL